MRVRARHSPSSLFLFVLCSSEAKVAPSNHTLLLPDGGHYVGGYSEDHRQDGNGVAYRANGTAAASGHWTNGRLHGLAVTWDEHGKMKECGRFEPGRLVAECAVPRSLLPDDPATNNCQPIFNQLRTAAGCDAQRPRFLMIGSAQPRDSVAPLLCFSLANLHR